MSKHFRPCAGAIVFNKDGKVFLGSRIETANDSWQFPQGGIEAGEIPAEAACRELYEETGKVLKNTDITLTIHPAIPTADMSKQEQNHLSETVQEIIESALPEERRSIINEE